MYDTVLVDGRAAVSDHGRGVYLEAADAGLA